MNCERIGALIYQLRRKNKMTQKQLAERLGVTDKAVSKWERGNGLPDVSLLSGLGRVFSVNIEGLLSGELNENASVGGNMKNTKFAVCPICGSVTMTNGNAEITCCNRRLAAEAPAKAAPEQRLKVEETDGELYVSSGHPMTKENYISFVGALTGDRLTLVKQYPEWDLSLRLPRGHFKLVWYAGDCGLLYQVV